MTQSTMFLNNVTSVDHAYIGADGWVYGNSYSPTFRVSGNIDPEENVVVDFSTIKKDLKNHIDHPHRGLDHKLWFINSFSNGEVTSLKNGHLIVETPLLKYVGATDSVHVIDGIKTHEVDALALREITQNYVLTSLLADPGRTYSEIGLDVKTEIDMRPTTPDRQVVVPFNYTHGLRSSTSWGCQNMMHGHQSFLYFMDNNKDPLKWEKDLLEHKIAGFMHNKMFVWADNWYEKTRTLEYYSRDRGEFILQLKDESLIKRLIILPTETTIEHIAAFVASKWEDEFKECGVSEIFVSEGQNKGAVVEL